MSKRWVVNASPLILMGKIGQLSLLEDLSDELVLPDAVVNEIEAGAETDAARQWIAGQGLKYIQPVQPFDPLIAGWDLGAGETAVLTFARQHADFEAIIDDRAARNCATTLHIPVRGTLGVILMAKQARLIPNVKLVIEELRRAGLRIDATTVQKIMELSGE